MISALLLLVPLISSLVVLLIKGENAKKFALGFSLLQLVPTLLMLAQFKQDASSQFVLDFWWIPSLGISFKVGIDGISAVLVLLTNLLVPFIVLSSFHKKNYVNPSAFYSLILFMQMALIGVFTAMDGFLFYIFWELALLPIYFICLFWGGENRAKITFKFFLYTIAGSLLMLLALIYIYLQTPSRSFDIQELYAAGRALPIATQSILFWGLFIAFAIKMPVFPFHTWQPDTYTVAPTQGTMLLSGIMLKMGIYGLIRWLLPIVPAGVHEWGNVAVTLSIIGVVYASCIAIVQKDLKRLIAYSSIAHVGLISAGIFSLTVQGLQGAMVQMVSHGINVFALFYIVDEIEERTSTRDLTQLGGVRTIAPQFATAFMIVMLGSVALPLTNGFIGEFLLMNGLFQYNGWMAAFAGLSIILGAVYMLNAYQKSMLGEVNSTTSKFTDMNTEEMAILIPVVLMVLAFGFYPKPLLKLSEPAIVNLLTLLK
jgi:NADH-quinone oxidoreductase subunit M